MRTMPLALGICLATASTTALAQSANPVILYGRAYLMVESVEADGGTAPVARRTRVSDRNTMKCR